MPFPRTVGKNKCNWSRDSNSVCESIFCANNHYTTPQFLIWMIFNHIYFTTESAWFFVFFLILFLQSSKYSKQNARCWLIHQAATIFKDPWHQIKSYDINPFVQTTEAARDTYRNAIQPACPLYKDFSAFQSNPPYSTS